MATAKKAAKTAKKSVPAKSAVAKKSGIPQAPTDHYFVLVDGRTLKDVKELADALDSMADHVWEHHVNWERNDFARWIEDIFQDGELADRLRKAQGKHHSQIILYRHILERI